MSESSKENYGKTLKEVSNVTYGRMLLTSKALQKIERDESLSPMEKAELAAKEASRINKNISKKRKSQHKARCQIEEMNMLKGLGLTKDDL